MSSEKVGGDESWQVQKELCYVFTGLPVVYQS